MFSLRYNKLNSEIISKSNNSKKKKKRKSYINNDTAEI